MLKIGLHFFIFATIVFQATMLQSWQSEKHELVPKLVGTRPTDGVKPGPRPAESSLSIAQAAIDWINSGKWRKEDGTVQLPDGHHNKRVRDILKRIDPNTPLDSTVSMEATRACLEAARIFPGTAEYREAGYSKYTDHERRAALLGNISGSLTMKVCTGVKASNPASSGRTRIGEACQASKADWP